jgi:hypothetical protein
MSVLSSYEVVRRAIEFDGPDRLPLRFDSLGLSDVCFVDWNQIYPGDFIGVSDTILDHWGCLWVRSEMTNMGQIKRHPIADWGMLDRYRWPDPDDPGFYLGMEERFVGSEGKYVLVGYFMLLFERMWALRGFDNILVDLLMERERAELLADRIVEFVLAWIENVSQRFSGHIHGAHFSDDWGTQQGLIVSPELWRAFFKPRYRRIFEAMHRVGWHTWMHSDGKINAILDDLIEVGVDSINLQQPRVMGIEEVGQRFRGRICFESLCDIQHTLPFKGADEIREEARLLLKHWAAPDGGFILSDYGEGEAIGVEPEKKRIMLDAFLEADPWRCRR